MQTNNPTGRRKRKQSSLYKLPSDARRFTLPNGDTIAARTVDRFGVTYIHAWGTGWQKLLSTMSQYMRLYNTRKP